MRQLTLPLPYLYPGAENKVSHAALAHLVEQLIRNQQMISSSLIGGSIITRVYVQNLHINPCLILGLQRIFGQKHDEKSFVFSVLRRILIYPIYTLHNAGAVNGRLEPKTPAPLLRLIRHSFSTLWRKNPRKPAIHAGLRACCLYPIYTPHFFSLFGCRLGLWAAR